MELREGWDIDYTYKSLFRTSAFDLKLLTIYRGNTILSLFHFRFVGLKLEVQVRNVTLSKVFIRRRYSWMPMQDLIQGSP